MQDYKKFSINSILIIKIFYIKRLLLINISFCLIFKFENHILFKIKKIYNIIQLIQSIKFLLTLRVIYKN